MTFTTKVKIYQSQKEVKKFINADDKSAFKFEKVADLIRYFSNEGREDLVDELDEALVALEEEFDLLFKEDPDDNWVDDEEEVDAQDGRDPARVINAAKGVLEALEKLQKDLEEDEKREHEALNSYEHN